MKLCAQHVKNQQLKGAPVTPYLWQRVRVCLDEGVRGVRRTLLGPAETLSRNGGNPYISIYVLTV